MFWHLSRFGSSGQQRILLAENHPSTLPVHLGGQWGISKPAKKYNLQSVSWVCPRAFSQYHTPETPCLGGITEAYSSDAQTNLTLLQKLTTCHDGVGCMFMFATGGVKWSWVRKQNKIDWPLCRHGDQAIKWHGPGTGLPGCHSRSRSGSFNTLDPVRHNLKVLKGLPSTHRCSVCGLAAGQVHSHLWHN